MTLNVAEIAAHIGGDVHGDAAFPITGINTIDAAGPGDMTFAVDELRLKSLPGCKAAAILIPERLMSHVGALAETFAAVVTVRDIEQSMIDLLELFASKQPKVLPEPGCHATAAVDAAAHIGARVSIAAHVAIAADAVIGDDVVLLPGTVIERSAVIGPGSIIGPNAVVGYNCQVGAAVMIRAGVIIGTDGFGYRPAVDGSGLRKIPHLGNVIIEDDVEIGANTCIDRGKFGPTRIGKGTKIDNLCQIAHNCTIGRHCVIAALTGLSGSVTVGDGVQIAGGAGVADQLTIGDGATVGGGSGLTRDVGPGESVFGYPAQPFREAMRQHALMRTLRERLAAIEKQLRE
ncbi:MAG: UDP-3-O-(3-hydroxymyristoyl)glucosamine N-acyltransferase [Phycisphaerales bacterium]